MTDMNMVGFTGRLTDNISAKAVNNRFAVNGTVAVSRSYKGKDGKWVDETSFIDIQQWANSDSFTKGLTKGTYVYVQGSLLQKKWEAEGKKLSRIVVIADRITACPPQSKTEKDAKAEEAKAVVEEAGDADIPF